MDEQTDYLIDKQTDNKVHINKNMNRKNNK